MTSFDHGQNWSFMIQRSSKFALGLSMQTTESINIDGTRLAIPARRDSVPTARFVHTRCASVPCGRCPSRATATKHNAPQSSVNEPSVAEFSQTGSGSGTRASVRQVPDQYELFFTANDYYKPTLTIELKVFQNCRTLIYSFM